MCKNCDIKVKHIPGGTGETVLNETDRLTVQKPDCSLVVHAGTNDMTKILNT